VSCAEDYWEQALADVRQVDPGARLEAVWWPGVLVVAAPSDPGAMARGLRATGAFVRHLTPVQGPVAPEPRHLAAAVLEAGRPWLGVDSVTLDARGASGPLADAARDAAREVEAAWAAQGVAVVPCGGALRLSILCGPQGGLVGTVPASDTLSPWPGGIPRQLRDREQVSRAEAKLREALALFERVVAPGAQALDLGAAPGGWTRVLAGLGASVVAVDPGPLRADVEALPGVRWVRATALEYLERTRTERFDVIVNDMKMDGAASARIMRRAAERLRPGGWALMTVKLHAAHPRRQLQAAVATLSARYRVEGVRQLFHNRREVTVVLRVAGR
jgi:23S rRNA (cytidine2498-2'-O)-methyltransferase